MDLLKTTSIQFKVESKTEIQKVTMIDKIVSVSKQNIARDEIEGAKLRIENYELKMKIAK